MADNILEIIPKALEKYDRNNEKYKNIFNIPIEQIHFIEAQEDMKRNIIIFKDKNDDIIKKSTYELAGIYNSTDKFWIWAWAHPNSRKNMVYTSRTILNYGLNMDHKINPLLKTQLITSRFQISDLINLDIYISLSSYLTKINTIYPYKIYKDKSKSKKNYIIYFLYLFDF